MTAAKPLFPRRGGVEPWRTDRGPCGVTARISPPRSTQLRLAYVGGDPQTYARVRRVLDAAGGLRLEPANVPAPNTAFLDLEAEGCTAVVVDAEGLGALAAVLAGLRRQHPDLPLVVLVATADESRTLTMLRCGADECVSSGPSQLRRLPATLRAAIVRRASGSGEAATDAWRRSGAELHRQVRQQQAVVAFGQRALRGGDLDTVYADAVASAARVLQVDFGVVVEMEVDGETLRSRAGIGWRDGLMGHTAVGIGTDSHAGYTLQRGVAIAIDDLASETRFASSPVLRSHGVTSGLAVPILGDARLFGALAVYSRRRRAFSPDDVQFLEAMATTMAAASERERSGHVERYLAGIVESSDYAIIGHTLEGIIVSWNLAAERLYGHAAAAAIGRSILLVVPDDRRAETLDLLGRLRRGEPMLRLETAHVTRDGRRLEVAQTISPMVDAAGRTIGGSVIVRDISEATRTAAALRATTERLQALRDIDHAILVLAPPEDIAQAAVSRVRRMVGCARVSVSVFDESADAVVVLASDGTEATYMQTGHILPLQILGDLTPLQRGEVQVVGDLATEAPMPPVNAALAAAGLRTLLRVPLMVDGCLIGTLNMASTDVGSFASEHVEIAREVANQLAVALRQARLHAQIQRHAQDLELRVQARTEELEMANRELETFSYSVSHDLRAPLRSLDGFSRALREDCGDRLTAAGQTHLDRILRAVRRMAELIDGLLELSHLSRVALRRRPTDLSELALTVVADWRQAQPERDVSVRVETGLEVDADPVLLRAVLQNLIGNAWKYTSRRAAAHIEVGRLADAGAPVYFVRDDGAGFDMAYVDKLFGPFQRLHTFAEFEGTGIGLATVQRIVQRHGGRIWADGAVDGGATFYFTLPAR
ncbi:MAG: GAF domain-containing protein [bacterium]